MYLFKIKNIIFKNSITDQLHKPKNYLGGRSYKWKLTID